MTTITTTTTPDPANGGGPVLVAHAGVAETHSEWCAKRACDDSVRQPVWLSVLFTAGCVARGLSFAQPIAWLFDGERAFYTNFYSEPVVVVPFEVRLDPGHTLAVCWERGASDYSVHQTA